MEIAPSPPGSWPNSIRGINALAAPTKYAVYRTLIAPWIIEQFSIEPATLTINGDPAVRIKAPANSRAMEMSIWHNQSAHDPIVYINMADTFNNQLMVLLVVINDPTSPRYAIDRTADGEATELGTITRNVEAEITAMDAGLAPAQIRAGLRSFRSLVPVFETFVANMGHDIFLIEPLAYHNAITFEHYGFNYQYGRHEMEQINQAFQPGGVLFQKLDNSTPFRAPDAWRTVRGRSWAIHDGILGHPYTGIRMYKRIGINAGINTFPDAIW